MDKIRAIRVYDSNKKREIEIYVPIDVAERCQSDSEYAEDLFQQLRDQNIEEGSVLEIDTVETIKTDEQAIDNSESESKSRVDEFDGSDFERKTKRRKVEEKEKEIWSRSQTLKLLNAYQLCRNRKKIYNSGKEFWSAVARELLKQGLSRHYSKCTLKFRNLMRSYKISVHKENSNFPFTKEMEAIMKSGQISDAWLKVESDDDSDSKDGILAEPDESKKESKSAWSANDITKLVSICKKNKIILHKETDHRIWTVISSALAQQGVNKDENECRIKWDSIKSSFPINSQSSKTSHKSIKVEPEDSFDENGLGITDEDLKTEPEDSDEEDDDNPYKKEYPKQGARRSQVDSPYSWKFEEISALIEVYHTHKDKFLNRTNATMTVWEAISSDLRRRKVNRSPESCEKKWKTLYSMYATQKELNVNSSKFIYFNAIDKIFKANDGTEEVHSQLSHQNRCHCFEKKQADKQQRHTERMELLKRKLDLEERKVEAFEEYMSTLKNNIMNGRK